MSIAISSFLPAGLRTALRKALWLCGLRQTLPASVVNAVPIKEQNEPLCEINAEDFFLAEDVFSRKKALIRTGVYERLLLAKSHLPAGLTFKIYDAYRSRAEQKEAWDRQLIETRVMNPGLSEDALIRLTRLKVANPEHGGFGGHQTGGAVDLTLCDVYGRDVDMGCGVAQYNRKTATNCRNLTAEQRHNRLMLLNALRQAGFVNFPNEWWHFCYGDRMWAAYQRQPFASYGYIETV